MTTDQERAALQDWLESQRINGGPHGFECVGSEALLMVWQAATARQASELEALRKDAERIDWLADQFKTCTVYMSGQHPWAPNSYKLRQLAGPTFRAAIDAAKGQA